MTYAPVAIGACEAAVNGYFLHLERKLRAQPCAKVVVAFHCSECCGSRRVARSGRDDCMHDDGVGRRICLQGALLS